jgi:hypothetical protein
MAKGETADILIFGQRSVCRSDSLRVGEAAALLRVHPSWIYAHARELGGWRLRGDRGAWLFDRRRLLWWMPSL